MELRISAPHFADSSRMERWSPMCGTDFPPPPALFGDGRASVLCRAGIFGLYAPEGFGTGDRLVSAELCDGPDLSLL